MDDVRDLLKGVPALPATLPEDDRAVLKEFNRRRANAQLAEKCTKSLFEFAVNAWHVNEPTTPIILNWHIKTLCDVVQEMLEDWMAVQRGEMKRVRLQNIIINIPPGTLKSRIICVMGPVWMWLKWPSWRCIAFSGQESISVRDSIYRRDILESDWFQDIFRPSWTLKEDQNSKLSFNNTQGGFIQAKTAGQRVTGDRADCLLMDDVNDAQTVGSDEIRNKINLIWWDLGAYNRVNDPSNSLRMGIQQRLHDEDWSGHCLKRKSRGQYVWSHLCLPQEFDDGPCPCGRERCELPFFGKLDPRTLPGELLMPQRFSLEVLDGERDILGDAGYAGQHQQRPYPKGGGIIKKDWFRYYMEDPAKLKLDYVFQSWDMTFKDTKASDFVCGQVWGIAGTRRYLLDQFVKRADLPDTLRAVLAMKKRWPKTRAIYVEDKANGPGVIRMLRGKVEGVIPVNPQGGKVARANAVSYLIEGGDVYLPAKEIAPWVTGLLNEIEAFPNGSHDDQVDAMTQGLSKTTNLKFEHVKDERPEPARIWDSIAHEEKMKADSKQMWLESGFGNDLNPDDGFEDMSASPEEWGFNPPESFDDQE